MRRQTRSRERRSRIAADPPVSSPSSANASCEPRTHRPPRQRAHGFDHRHQAHALAHRDVLPEDALDDRRVDRGDALGGKAGSERCRIAASALADTPEGFSTAKCRVERPVGLLHRPHVGVGLALRHLVRLVERPRRDLRRHFAELIRVAEEHVRSIGRIGEHVERVEDGLQAVSPASPSQLNSNAAPQVSSSGQPGNLSVRSAARSPDCPTRSRTRRSS